MLSKDCIAFDCCGKHAPDNLCNYFVDIKSGLVAANFAFINSVNFYPINSLIHGWITEQVDWAEAQRLKGSVGS